MKNILLSLFVLSCLFVNTAFAEEVKSETKKPVANYEASDSEDLSDPSLNAGSNAIGDTSSTIDHNKTKEAVDQANSIKDKIIEGYNEDEEIEDINSGKEAKDTETEKVLKEEDEDLMEIDKEIIKEDEKESESTPCKEAKAPAKK